MRTSYIKPNSFTQESATAMLETVKSICIAANITHEQWAVTFFETGCLYAELHAPSLEISHKWLTDPSFEFWSIWMAEYVQDDADLLDYCYSLEGEEYVQLKLQFV